MNRNDRDAIEKLFGKLADVERGGAPRDEEAEYFIADMIRRQPGAPYYMAQTIVMQEQALEAAQRRIEDLEAGAAGSQRSGGGLLDSVFGGSRSQAPARGSVPRVGRPVEAQRTSPWGAGAGGGSPLGGSGFGGGYGRGGGGFLAGAAQTAMGVAGGVLLGNALAGMFDGGEAQAAESADTGDAGTDAGADAGANEAGFDGGDAGFGDFGGGEL